ncbi:MAG: CpXC domain-containing protein [Elusimicrobia bacterium]|nr:CpXC domain-containing protein [Candidatus Omnitrophota bacterium]MCG2725318.1 CpXC domain-containing protein [Elusimicrobiota bacterium]
MAIKGKFKITCPFCDHEFEGDFWTIVRGDRDFKLKEMLVQGEFDLFMCPLCKNVFVQEETFIYHDRKMDLFVFVLPSAYIADKEKWTKKMEDDYGLVKETMDKEFSGQPFILFGAGALRDLLLRDRDIEEETEVAEFMARDLNMKISPMKAGFAREHDFPLAVPYIGDEINHNNILKAVNKIYSANKSLPKLNKFLEFLKLAESQDLNFLKNENKNTQE